MVQQDECLILDNLCMTLNVLCKWFVQLYTWLVSQLRHVLFVTVFERVSPVSVLVKNNWVFFSAIDETLGCFWFSFFLKKYIKFALERGVTERGERGEKIFLKKKSMTRAMNSLYNGTYRVTCRDTWDTTRTTRDMDPCSSLQESLPAHNFWKFKKFWGSGTEL